MMRKQKIITVGVVLIMMVSCSSVNNSSKHLEPLNIEIPTELEGNLKVVKFIESSEVVINHWSDTLEELFDESEEYLGKEESDLSMKDKMKLAQIGFSFMSKMAEFGTDMSQLNTTAMSLEDGLSDKELQAFELTR